MGVEDDFRTVVERALRSLVKEGRLPPLVLGATFSVERPRRADHGDMATNLPLSLAKKAGMAPPALAALLKGQLEKEPSIRSVEVAGAGFMNVRLAPAAFHGVLAEMVRAGEGYGRAAAGSGERILLEFVSANPTGPLLISHARGALLGDFIGRILEAAGHHVSREYYVNDFGNQVRTFALSVAAAAFGEPPPPDGYPGAYVTAVARYLERAAPELLAAHRGSRENEETFSELCRQCVTRMLDGVPGSSDLPGIKATLRSLGVVYDSWVSEEAFHRWGRVQAALDRLREGGYVQPLADGALVFRLPEGMGEADEEYAGGEGGGGKAGGGRVVRKSDAKTYTYFASDIAYHADKIDRGYGRLLTVLGADHHGYVARIRNVLLALGLPRERFEVVLYQLVSLVRDGKVVKMGKRLGNLITIDEVLEEIDQAAGQGAGSDALRYFYLSRRTENPVELNADLAKKTTIENPVVYLQYGHARFCSLLRNARALGIDVPAWDAELIGARLTHPLELSMLQRLGAFPRVVQQAAKELAPSLIINFLEGVAQDFHAYWTQTWKARDPMLPSAETRRAPGWEAGWDFDRTRARLFWVNELRKVYATGLSLVGIRAPERVLRLAEATEGEDEAVPGKDPGDG